MTPEPDDPSAGLTRRVDAVTPARLFVGRAGTAYRTSTLLRLRADHAAARDAVAAQLDLDDPALVALDLFEVATEARTPAEHLLRPDLGRRLTADARVTIAARCLAAPALQVVVGDGLSAEAVRAQVPVVLPRLVRQAAAAGWMVGTTFAVRHCRVGVMNDVGDVLQPEVVVLLIGERPGLATADSLSAYLAHRPRPGCTDADRNLVSNIHGRGLPADDAVDRILALATACRAAGSSGVGVRVTDHLGGSGTSGGSWP
jgi:ethanolamine ammonia-lyase small subunit